MLQPDRVGYTADWQSFLAWFPERSKRGFAPEVEVDTSDQSSYPANPSYGGGPVFQSQGFFLFDKSKSFTHSRWLLGDV